MEDKELAEGTENQEKTQENVVSVEDFRKFQSEADAKYAALQKELEETQRLAAEKDRLLAEMEAQDKALRDFLASQEGDTRARLEKDIQAAKQQASSQRQMVEAARILKAKELVSQEGALVTLNELLDKPFRSPEEMEMFFIRTNAEKQIAQLRKEVTDKAGKGTAQKKTEESSTEEKVEVPGNAGVAPPTISPAESRDKRERCRRGSVRFLEDTWKQLSGQASRKAQV